MIVLKVLLSILTVILLGTFLAGLIVVIRTSYALFHHACKHCHKIMDYKGLRENEKESHYLLHCPHCGAWEQIDKGELTKKVAGFNTEDYGKACNS